MSILRAATAYIRYRRPHVLGGAIQVAWQARGRWDPLRIFFPCRSVLRHMDLQLRKLWMEEGVLIEEDEVTATEELARATPGAEALEAGLLIF